MPSPADAAAEAAFAAFLTKVPDAPSSAHTQEAPAEAADAPLDTKETPESPAAPATAAPKKPPRVRRASDDQSPASIQSAKTPSTGDPQATPDPAAVLAALRAGDLDTIADLLGEDPAGFDEKTPRWAARQRKEAKITADRDRVMAQAETVVQRWSPVSRLVESAQTNPAALFELVGLLTGQDPDQAWTAALRARGSVDPRVPALTTRLAEKDTRLAELEAERTARVDAAFYETLRDEVDVKSVVRQIEGWEAKVATTLRESIDPDLGEPKLSVKQAADRVVRREREEYERRAKVFGGGDAPAPKKTKERAPERAAGTAGATVRKLTRAEWLAARSNG